jgi:adenosyl cobinamide kinase/adenosyl cobinamide phosphate guanylyltransferase
MGFLLVLGGARSGKSSLADRLGRESAATVTFIATATAGDADMAARIQRHRESRPVAWSTVEAPIDLLAAIAATPAEDFVIVDCLTLWVANLLGSDSGPEEIRRLSLSVARELALRSGVVVTNEVGLGVVPVNELARVYRDTLGAVNSIFAERAERSVLMVAGRVLDLKPA